MIIKLHAFLLIILRNFASLFAPTVRLYYHANYGKSDPYFHAGDVANLLGIPNKEAMITIENFKRKIIKHDKQRQTEPSDLTLYDIYFQIYKGEQYLYYGACMCLRDLKCTEGSVNLLDLMYSRAFLEVKNSTYMPFTTFNRSRYQKIINAPDFNTPLNDWMNEDDEEEEEEYDAPAEALFFPIMETTRSRN